MVHANLFKRIIAFLIDMMLGIFWFALPVFLGVYLYQNHGIELPSLLPLFLLLCVPFYLVYLPYKWGYTLGMKWMKIKMINESEKKISLGQSILRYFISITLSSGFLGLGFLWAIWNKDKQTWHDRIAKTIIVNK